MAYVQPHTVLSSIRIEGGVDSPYSDEDDCKMYLIEYDNFVPRRVKLTGILWIDGFEVVG